MADRLESLGSKGQQHQLLDEIDKLRGQGIAHYVSLPQIVVCGDQSSGKSSVLEAISGIAFPTKDNLCTQFATEVILRRAPAFGIAVSIVPHQDRTEESRKQILGFRETLKSVQDLTALFKKAKAVMGIQDADKASSSAFSNDILRLEISGPEKPHLTIVDLPGLIHTANKGQTLADVTLVTNLVRSYMENSRSVVLAVVSAKNDIANQIVLNIAKEVDPGGCRTIGIITKPDTLPSGSESELGFVELAQNKNIDFRLGWHVVMNRDYERRNTTTEERDAAEACFFSGGVWKGLPRRVVGIASLRGRLSQVLLDQIKAELPGLIQDIQGGVDQCKSDLAKLGVSRESLAQQRQFLSRISQSFQAITRAATNGHYSDVFFGDPTTDYGYSIRLGAVVQNLNRAFSCVMDTQGKSRRVVQNAANTESGDISREAFIDEILGLLERTRGAELPGMYNPMIVGDLFFQQSKPWESLARSHVKDVWQAVKHFVDKLISSLTDDVTMDCILQEVVWPVMDRKLKEVNLKLDEILAPHKHGHPITYNHYFTESIQIARQEFYQQSVVAKINSLIPPSLRTTFTQASTVSDLGIGVVKTSKLLETLSSRTEADMDRHACSEILVCVEAYYKASSTTYLYQH